MATDIHCIIEAMVGPASGVRLLRPFIDDVPPCVIGDPDRLRGILLNLYTNAAKFTRRGALALHVSVSGPNYQPLPHEDGDLPWSSPAADDVRHWPSAHVSSCWLDCVILRSCALSSK